MAEIPLGAESAGTLKMFALYPELQEVLEKGSVFFIDELNARLHPLLVSNFNFLHAIPRTSMTSTGNIISNILICYPFPRYPILFYLLYFDFPILYIMYPGSFVEMF